MHPHQLVVAREEHAIAAMDFGTIADRDGISPEFAPSLPLPLTEPVDGGRLAVGR